MIDAKLKFKNPLVPLDITKLTHIVVHHLAASIATPNDIHNWHLANGWSGAGYNEYIRKDGTVYSLRGDNQGAHCLGYNEIGYGIALEGDFDKEIVTKIQYDILIERLQINKARFPNLKRIVGHREVGSTTCPGKNFKLPIMLPEIIKAPDHWAQNAFNELNLKGIKINETRFDDKITRAEIFVLLNQIIKGK